MTNATSQTTPITRALTAEECLRFESAEQHELALTSECPPYTIEDRQREGQWIMAVGPFSQCFDNCGQSLSAS